MRSDTAIPTQKTSLKKQASGSYAGLQNDTEQVTVQVDRTSTDQVAPLRELSTVQWVIVKYADTPRSFAELMKKTGYSKRPQFKVTHLEPLIGEGIIRMTIPEKPTSSKQRFVLTEAGLKLKETAPRYRTSAAERRQQMSETLNLGADIGRSEAECLGQKFPSDQARREHFFETSGG